MHATDMLGAALIARARNAVAGDLGLTPVAMPAHQELHRPGATFVTLFTSGALHGCVGSLEASRSLEDDVRANAVAAAFRDPRFAPLRVDEFAATRFEVSVLGPATRVEAASENNVLAALVPHRDGVILAWRDRRATLLPQVWETLPEPRAFLQALKHKAGLAADFWSPEIRIERYTVTSFHEAPRVVA